MTRALSRALLLVAATAGAWTSSAAAQDEAPLRITDELLAELGERAVAAVEAELGVVLEPAPAFRIATPHEVAGALARENGDLFREAFPDPHHAQAQIDAFALSTADLLIAKVLWGTNEVLVIPEILEASARLLEEPRLLTREGLLATLAHEVVHVADDQRSPALDRIAAIGDFESVQAWNAVQEGHAQFIGRRSAERLGVSDAFRVISESMGRIPSGGAGDIDELFLSVESAQVSLAYDVGESFVEALYGGGGLEAVHRALDAPPAHLEILFHPEWFLDPSQRPPLLFDFDAALDTVEQHFPTEHYGRMRQTFTPPIIAATLAPLPLERTKPLLEKLRRARGLVLPALFDPGGTQYIFILFELAEPEDAAAFESTLQEVLSMRPQIIEASGLEVRETEKEEVAGEDFGGTWIRRVIGAPGMPAETTTSSVLILRRGRLLLELDAVNADPGRDWAIGWGKALLDAATATRKPADGEAPVVNGDPND